MIRNVLSGGVIVAGLGLLPGTGRGDEPPVAVPMPPPMPAVVDRAPAGAGRIALAVDATDLERRMLSVHETLAVAHGGDTVVLYPEWIPGNHGPTGNLDALAGLVVHASTGQRLAWVRDAVDMYALHVDVPKGAAAIDLDFQVLTPTKPDEGRVVMSPRMLNLEWNGVVLYPAGIEAQAIAVDAAVRLPEGWRFASALDVAGNPAGSTVRFREVPLDTLVDSPLIAGTNFSRIDLDPGAKVPVHLDVVADRPAELAATEAQIVPHRALIAEERAMFGAHHYDHYDFLLMLSDEIGGEGLEHHRSSEDAVGGDYFTGWDTSFGERDLLAHEYTHSWNGKFRRPADLWSPNFDVPERDSLLWVYEGLTEYWGQVMAARSGLWSRQDALEALAADAASEREAPGRAWRTLADTTNDPIFKRRAPISWRDWQRDEDYYIEGLLVWLDADTLIRERTQGHKSLDDFARAFFGMEDGAWTVSTYGFDDVVRGLNTVCPYDWAGFLHARLDTNPPGPPLDGITRGGYRLAFDDKPNLVAKSLDDGRSRRDFRYSIGLALRDGAVSEVSWRGPAWKAGVVVGDKLLGVNGMTFDKAADLAAAVADAKTSGRPIELLLGSGRFYRTVSIADVGGLRYPHLVRVSGTADRLDAILSPRAAASPPG